MNSPYPSGPKKLYRSRGTRMIGGVCGGLADYLNMDVTLVRILTAVITLFTGIPVILYILAMFLVPEEPTAGRYGYPPVQPPTTTGSDVWGATGAPWEQPQDNPNAAPKSTDDLR